MIYNIFFSIKESEDVESILAKAKLFAASLMERDEIESYRLEKVVDKQKFVEMLDYHMAIYFKDSDTLAVAFNTVRDKYLNIPPHSELMSSVSNFKVSFTEVVVA